MNLDNEDQRLPDCSSSIHSEKHSKISYTREFLLSLSELEICKKLPIEFDQSILSEFEGTSHAIPDRQRTLSGPSSQGFRRNEYGSSPPTRGIYGRWDNRFSARSDQESDAQSARDSESGRRHGNQPRRSWQSPEHDGLLGSGSFPRPSVYASSGIPAPKARGSDNYQLSKTNEPYHPPRPYKAGPQSRRDASDSFNNETFGSVDCASEDRVEEERRRRASFELMRKEQQKAALQKKQIVNPDKPENGSVSGPDMSVFAEDVKEESGLLDRRKELDASTTSPDTDNDSGKSSFPSQSSASRPLIPPGFRSTILEKDTSLKALVHPPLKQAGKPETEESLLHSGVDPVQNGFFDGLERQLSQSSQELCPSDQLLVDKSIHIPFLKNGNQIDVSNKNPCIDDNINRPSSILETQKLMEDPETIEFSAKLSQEKIGGSDLNQSTSILDKIFGSAVSMAVVESEHQETKPDDKWSSRNIRSSKFAHWFAEEAETKPKDDSSSRPNDLLALIAGGDNSRSQVCDAKSTENILSNALAATLEVSEPLHASSKDNAVAAVLTCEDLEQSMLSEYSENSSTLQALLPGWSTNSKSEEQTEHVDDHASQHLLSLLQKGPDLGDKSPKSNMDTDLVGAYDKFIEDNKSLEGDSHALSKAITLETLFGTAFMNELQSMQAPVSIQGGSVASGQTNGLESQRSSLPVPNDGFFPSTVDDMGGSRRMSNDESNVLVDKEQTKLGKGEKWLGFDDSLAELNLKQLSDRSYKNVDGVAGFQLPEDESLFSGGNPGVSQYMADGNLIKGEFHLPNAPMGVAEQLASVHAAPSNQRSMVGPGGLSLLHGPRDQMEPEMFRNLPAQPSSSLFHPMQMSQGRPFHSLETLPAQTNAQMKFLGPEIMAHIDNPSHPFSGNMMRPPFHRSNPAVSGFDLPVQHPMLQPQMQMPGNYPHMQHDRLRSAPFPPHPANQPAAFLQEPNPMQVLPFGPRPPRQPNINGFGIPMPADINRGNNQPEAIQRLFEMEARANSKQMHPFTAGNSQGMYGHELDMGLRYR